MQSYASFIDKGENGDSNNKVDLQEFINHELSKLPSSATEEQKKEAKLKAQIAFNKIDLNKDGIADWKEFAATFATFDEDKDKKLDGIIRSDDYARWSSSLSTNQTTTFDQGIKRNYNYLFGKSDK